MSTQTIPNSFERIELLIREIDDSGDPATQARLQEIVQAMLDYHGAAITRLVEAIRQTKGPDVMQNLASDELISSLLLLYDLHPVDLQTRIEQALDKVRPYLQSHGGEVEVLSTDGGIVRLRMKGSCHGCPSSALTMQTTIEQAIYAAAPDIAELEVEGIVSEQAATPAGFVSLAAVADSNGRSPCVSSSPH
jgi:Fe-S cluster biogenesis protein NfuA